jgi:hypothetical protein
MQDVPDRTLGPVLAADRLDFTENSTKHCSLLCSVRRSAGDGCQPDNSKPAMRKVIFHRRSDSAMSESIAVPRGNGCRDRVVAAFVIGLLRLTLARQIPRSMLSAKIVPYH